LIHHLKLWGSCIEKVMNWSGYQSSDPTWRAIYGNGTHRDNIPIPDMPAFAVQLSNEINKLKPEYRVAIQLRYAYNMSPNGWWTEQQKAEALGISVDNFRYRCSAARKCLLASWNCE
jgi:hypothetical protein